MNTVGPIPQPEPLQTPEQWAQEIAQWQAESIGWLPLEQGAYVHMPKGVSAEDVGTIMVVGNATVPPDGWAALLLA